MAPRGRRRVDPGLRGDRSARLGSGRRGGRARAGRGGDRRLRRSLSAHRRQDQQTCRPQCHGARTGGRGQNLYWARRQCRRRSNPDPARGYPSHAGSVGACAHRLSDGGKRCPPGRRSRAHRQSAEGPGPDRQQPARLRPCARTCRGGARAPSPAPGQEAVRRCAAGARRYPGQARRLRRRGRQRQPGDDHRRRAPGRRPAVLRPARSRQHLVGHGLLRCGSPDRQVPAADRSGVEGLRSGARDGDTTGLGRPGPRDGRFHLAGGTPGAERPLHARAQQHRRSTVEPIQTEDRERRIGQRTLHHRQSGGCRRPAPRARSTQGDRRPVRRLQRRIRDPHALHGRAAASHAGRLQHGARILPRRPRSVRGRPRQAPGRSRPQRLFRQQARLYYRPIEILLKQAITPRPSICSNARSRVRWRISWPAATSASRPNRSAAGLRA